MSRETLKAKIIEVLKEAEAKQIGCPDVAFEGYSILEYSPLD